MTRRRCVVVLDDDPTGTQSASNVTVLLTWDADIVEEALATADSVYLQTNSRALDERDAIGLVQAIRGVTAEVADRLDIDVRLVLRGDSTLRGHVVAETRAIAEVDAVHLFVPAFPAGGRITRNGVHHLRQDGRLVPVSQTEYAHDPVFGFSSSRLTAFIESYSGARALHVPLDEVRTGRLAGVLREAPAGCFVVPDAENDEDIGIIAEAVERVWDSRAVTVRTAAPLAAALAKVVSRQPLDAEVLSSARSVLVVCGSHTDGARAQVAALSTRLGPPTVVRTTAALRDPYAEGARAAAEELSLSRPGAARFVATERDRCDSHDGLQHGAAVMQALTVAARLLAAEAEVVVTKGGITSAEVVRQSLGARAALVCGQVRPGVSVWRVRTDAGQECDCVIVPGNMGDPEILVEAVDWVIGAVRET
ncbi:four-carbon acid sugar kinase family protein [Microbacterium sp. MAHUQ-60]|uniref:four-carbon acid sugar kinase family protein n=1 Tax=unclassified Microbacterium TaxID=2609290 RepID=UPI0036177157